MREAVSILLIGAGGHCKSCIDLISTVERYNVAGIVDEDGSNVKRILGIKVIGTDSNLELLIQKYTKVLISVGQIKSPKLRINLFDLAKSFGASFPVLCSPTTHVAKDAKIDEGTICFHHSVINSSVQIGKNCIINTGAVVEHETRIGSHCHISTGALVNGNVEIEDGCFIGSGAILHQGVKIGEKSVIGAGKIVKTNIPPNTTFR